MRDFETREIWRAWVYQGKSFAIMDDLWRRIEDGREAKGIPVVDPH
jgi:hypothetical protein